MKRNIGAELAARIKHLNEMLANGEGVGAISRDDADSQQPVAFTHGPHATQGDGISHGECRLADAERMAIGWAARQAKARSMHGPAAALYALLERTK